MSDLSDIDDATSGQQARPADLSLRADLMLGPVRVQPSLRRIAGPVGEVMLEPKVMQVLLVLADPPGAILSRDALIEACWGGRAIGDTSVNRVISLLRSALRQGAGDAVLLENVPKVGYRLLVPEEAPESAPAPAGAEPAAPAKERGRTKKIATAFAIVAVFALVAALALWRPGGQSSFEPVKVTMLPLEIADGIDPLYGAGFEARLRAELARVGAMEVTGGESARVLADQGLDAAEIGRRLGADYVWTGRIVALADRVVFETALIAARGDVPGWSVTLASAPDEGQNLPFRAARAVALHLGRPVIGEGPGNTISADDYRLYLTAVGLIKSRGVEQRKAAYEILSLVTERNPRFADGWGAFAKVNYLYPDFERFREYRARALELALKAVAINPETVDALKVEGMMSEDARRRLEALRRATELDPGDAESWYWLSITQRDFPLLARGGALDSALRMVAVDPLWPASWSASDVAAEYGRMDLARKAERDILSAAVTPTQKGLAEARLRRIEGDYSGFFRAFNRVAGSMNETERRYGGRRQTAIARYLLDLPSHDGDPDLFRLREMVPALRHIDVLPSRAKFEAAGLYGAGYWENEPIVMATLSLFLKEGRGAELLYNFDARFASAQELYEFVGREGEPGVGVLVIGPYVAAAMQEAGRHSEAKQLLDLGEAAIARWKEADTGWVFPVLYEMKLAALKNEDARLAGLVRQLPKFGWPYTMGHVHRDVVGLIRDDPLYERARELPEIRAVIDPILANIAKERAELIAMGLD